MSTWLPSPTRLLWGFSEPRTPFLKTALRSPAVALSPLGQARPEPRSIRCSSRRVVGLHAPLLITARQSPRPPSCRTRTPNPSVRPRLRYHQVATAWIGSGKPTAPSSNTCWSATCVAKWSVVGVVTASVIWILCAARAEGQWVTSTIGRTCPLGNEPVYMLYFSHLWKPAFSTSSKPPRDDLARRGLPGAQMLSQGTQVGHLGTLDPPAAGVLPVAARFCHSTHGTCRRATRPIWPRWLSAGAATLWMRPEWWWPAVRAPELELDITCVRFNAPSCKLHHRFRLCARTVSAATTGPAAASN